MNNLTSCKENFLSILNRINEISSEFKYQAIINISKKAAGRIKDDSFRIVVVGEFNRGKSTLLNALIGQDIIPTGVNETTATINILKYSEKPSITTFYQDGTNKQEQFSNESLQKYNALEDIDHKKINRIEIYYPSEYLKNGVEIVDTPGVNDPDEHRTEITYGYIPNSDAIIFVLNAAQSFTLSEQRFLNDYILLNKIPSIFYVVNRIDEVQESKLPSIIEATKKKIVETSKNNDPILIPVSALKALEGRLTKNNDACLQSGLITFQDKLIEFLYSDEKAKAKIDALNTHTASVLTKLDDAISVDIVTASKTIEELKNIKTKVISEEQRYRDELERIMDKMDTELEYLLSSIQVKLQDKFLDFREQLMIEVKTTKLNIKEFAEDQIPLKYKRFIKGWLESYGESTDKKIKSILVQALTEFEKKFSKRAIVNSLSVQKYDQDLYNPLPLSLSLNDPENNEKLAMGFGATLFTGMIGIATGGIALIPMILGGYGGILAGKTIYHTFIAKKIITQQKNELIEILDTMLNGEYQNLNKYISENIREKFNEAKKVLVQQFENIFSGIKHDLDDRIKSYDNKQETNRLRLESLVARKDEVALLINQTNKLR